MSWIEKELGSLPSLNIAVYTVDDPLSQHHVPKNKGNEAMVYLTYLIDNYDNLSEVTMVRFEASSLVLSSLKIDTVPTMVSWQLLTSPTSTVHTLPPHLMAR